LISDFLIQLKYFFTAPEEIDTDAVKPKWDQQKADFFKACIQEFASLNNWIGQDIENVFKQTASTYQLKPGDVQLPFRIMLVGGKFGPAVFEIAAIIGKDATLERMNKALNLFNK
jgi:glutamyl-tRNA synthetase